MSSSNTRATKAAVIEILRCIRAPARRPIPAGLRQRTEPAAELVFNTNGAKRRPNAPARMPRRTPADNWVRLRPGPQRIDELADFIEWIANAKPEDEQAIRAEIKRYFYDVGDQGSAAALNSALTVLLRPGITKEDRQQILDHQLDAFYPRRPWRVRTNPRFGDWRRTSGRRRAADRRWRGHSGGAGLGGMDLWLGQARAIFRSTAP